MLVWIDYFNYYRASTNNIIENLEKTIKQKCIDKSHINKFEGYFCFETPFNIDEIRNFSNMLKCKQIVCENICNEILDWLKSQGFIHPSVKIDTYSIPILFHKCYIYVQLD